MTVATPVTKPTKTIIATIGGLLTVAVPLVTSLLTYLPPQWAAVINGVIALLTVLGVYAVPNKPTGQVVIAADGQEVYVPPGVNLPISPGADAFRADLDAQVQQQRQNPWKNRLT